MKRTTQSATYRPVLVNLADLLDLANGKSKKDFIVTTNVASLAESIAKRSAKRLVPVDEIGSPRWQHIKQIIKTVALEVLNEG